MLQPVDYGAFLRSGQSLVPDLAAEAIRERLAGVQEQEAQAQALSAQARLAEQQRETNDAQAFQRAVAEYQQRPTVEGLSALMVRFPQFSEGLKRAFDAQDESQQRSDFRSLGQIHSALLSGRTDLALGELDRRIAADRTAGREIDPIEQDMRDAIASGDPQRIATAQGMARRLTAMIAGPERFASVYEVDNPRLRNVSPGDVVVDENTGRAAQSPVPQMVPTPAGLYEVPLQPGIAVIGGGVAPPAQATAEPASGERTPAEQANYDAWNGTTPTDSTATTNARSRRTGSRGYASTPFSEVRERILGSEGPTSLGGYNAIAYNTSPTSNAAGVRPPRPVTQMTIGEVVDWQGPTRGAGPNTMRARTRGRRGRSDVGSTGVGAYQFERSTLIQNARRAFGENWRSQPFSPANQERIAETLWNTVRGNPALLGNTWAAFSGGRSAPSRRASGSADGPVRIRSVQAYNRLAAGTEYIDPNGVRRVKQ